MREIKLFFIFLLFSGSLLAQIRPIPELSRSAVCKRTCNDSMAQVHFYQLTTCPAQPQVIHGCAPFGCDAKKITCKTTCTQDADCSKGFACNVNTQKCETVSYFCASNRFNAGILNGTDGTSMSCEPYTCRMGSCLARCTSQADCWPGYECSSDFICKIY